MPWFQLGVNSAVRLGCLLSNGCVPGAGQSCCCGGGGGCLASSAGLHEGCRLDVPVMIPA